jgi:hypothetical protein
MCTSGESARRGLNELMFVAPLTCGSWIGYLGVVSTPTRFSADSKRPLCNLASAE